MPLYRWSGRARSGEERAGTIDAPSKEEAVIALRAQNVTTIEERTTGDMVPVVIPTGSTRKGGLARILVGLLMLGGAVLMSMIAKGTQIRCVRTAAAYDCTIETTMAGFHVLHAEDIHGARSATSEERTTSSYDSRTKTRGKGRVDRVVIAGEKKTLATEWMAHPMASCDWVAGTLNENFAKRQAPSFQTWQIETPQAAVALVLTLVGLWLAVNGLRRLFQE